MSALGKVVRAGVGRRRVQTAVMTLTTLLAVTAAVLASGLLVASRAPFDHAFARQRGAHLTAQFDGARVTTTQLAATAHVPGVTATAGPFPVLSLQPSIGMHSAGAPAGLPMPSTAPTPPMPSMPPMTIVGRASAGGPVDDLDLTAGRWPTGPGQIVWAGRDGPPLRLGEQMTFPEVPGDPTLTVVGIARSVIESADAWVTPEQLSALRAPGVVPAYQMLYRFAAAATDTQVTADRAALAAVVPAGSMTGAASYLKIKRDADRTSATFAPFVVALGALGLCMSILIIGIVVGGAVGAATRRIGILKSLGFTPAQVVRAYVGQALIPATTGTALGVVLGNLLAVPLLNTTENAYDTGTLTVAPWIDIAVPAVALAAVVATALAPALRAGRLRTIEAIAVGRTPSAGRGRTIRRLLGRLPLSRPVSLGLANPFTRPARSATLAAAVALGAIGVTFGVGLAASLTGIQHGLERDTVGDVRVDAVPPPGPGVTLPPRPADAAALAAAIGGQSGTRRFFRTGQAEVSVAGLAGATTVIGYQGDSSWGSYQMIAGSWFHGPGEAVVSSGFLDATGAHLGDTVTLANAGHTVPLRIVGEAFSLRDDGQAVLTDAASLGGLGARLIPESIQFDIELKPGTDRQSYLDSLNAVLKPLGAVAESNAAEVDAMVVAMDALAGMLTAMLVVVAGLGVLNTVVLDTRERVHDLGVFKALGMSPRQTIAMVVTSVAGIGLLAGVVGVPIGIALHHEVLPAMGRAAGTRIPAVDIAVYHLPVLIPLALGGLVIAVAGALLPAGWAARTRTATALRTE